MEKNMQRTLTHAVVVGYFKSPYIWVTECCVPFVNEKSAIEYKNIMLSTDEFQHRRCIVVPYAQAL